LFLLKTVEALYSNRASRICPIFKITTENYTFMIHD